MAPLGALRRPPAFVFVGRAGATYYLNLNPQREHETLTTPDDEQLPADAIASPAEFKRGLVIVSSRIVATIDRGRAGDLIVGVAQVAFPDGRRRVRVILAVRSARGAVALRVRDFSLRDLIDALEACARELDVPADATDAAFVDKWLAGG